MTPRLAARLRGREFPARGGDPPDPLSRVPPGAPRDARKAAGLKANAARLYLNAALKLIDQTKATQPMRTSNLNIRGAVAGSHPIWGGYIRFGFPNWAAKFLADAIMMADATVAKLEGEAR